ncbi:MAG: ABC transporter ATP-binding protein, partial [Clostridiales bacterium]|nr:ABC transporter ATP-binding protein [Clostridiales bacterium]
MKSTGVYELRDRRVENLSGGQRQRVWIAMALAQETEILVLDEPTTYLDMAHQLEILQLLKKLNRDNQTTIVMVLHELNNACKFADHIIGLKKGSLVFEGTPKDVITKENLRKLYQIEATLKMSEDNSYPICMDFELVQGNESC